MPSPVLGGNYTCHIPAHLLSDACVTDLGGDGEDTVKAGVTVDELKARLTLIEAEQKTIKKENSRLKEELARVKNRHIDDASEFRDAINGKVMVTQEEICVFNCPAEDMGMCSAVDWVKEVKILMSV